MNVEDRNLYLIFVNQIHLNFSSYDFKLMKTDRLYYCYIANMELELFSKCTPTSHFVLQSKKVISVPSKNPIVNNLIF